LSIYWANYTSRRFGGRAGLQVSMIRREMGRAAGCGGEADYAMAGALTKGFTYVINNLCTV